MILEYKKKILEFEGKLKKPASEKGKNCLKLLFAIDKREYVEDIPPPPSHTNVGGIGRIEAIDRSTDAH